MCRQYKRSIHVCGVRRVLAVAYAFDVLALGISGSAAVHLLSLTNQRMTRIARNVGPKDENLR